MIWAATCVFGRLGKGGTFCVFRRKNYSYSVGVPGDKLYGDIPCHCGLNNYWTWLLVLFVFIFCSFPQAKRAACDILTCCYWTIIIVFYYVFSSLFLCSMFHFSILLVHLSVFYYWIKCSVHFCENHSFIVFILFHFAAPTYDPTSSIQARQNICRDIPSMVFF